MHLDLPNAVSKPLGANESKNSSCVRDCFIGRPKVFRCPNKHSDLRVVPSPFANISSLLPTKTRHQVAPGRGQLKRRRIEADAPETTKSRRKRERRSGDTDRKAIPELKLGWQALAMARARADTGTLSKEPHSVSLKGTRFLFTFMLSLCLMYPKLILLLLIRVCSAKVRRFVSSSVHVQLSF
jgi:hypothetical protein